MKTSLISSLIIEMVKSDMKKLSISLKSKWYKVQLTKEQRKGKTFEQLQELKKEIYFKKTKTNLRFSLYGQFLSGDDGHPQGVMAVLKIKYEYAVPQSIGDQWWFINCEYSCELPEYISIMGEIECPKY